MAIEKLSPDVLDLILSALQLYELLPVRRTCRLLHQRVQPRFLPVVAPPSISFGPSLAPGARSDKKDIQLYGTYLRWLRRWWELYDAAHPERRRRVPAKLMELRSQCTVLDGFFSLAPWWRQFGEIVPAFWQPEQWLHEALYESGGDQSRGLCPFYQRRVRDEDDAFRIFYSTPAEAWQFATEEAAAPRTRRIVLAPLNVRSSKKADASMPDLNAEMLGHLQAVHELIRCYLPCCDVRVEEMRELRVNNRSLTRKDVQGATRAGEDVRQLSSKALHGARAEIDSTLDDELRQIGRVRSPACEPFITFVVAPHLYPHAHADMGWVYSTGLREVVGPCGIDERVDAWAVSTHQIECFVEEGVAQAQELCKTMLYCVFLNATGLDICESASCLMNNSDSVGESAAVPLLLCPTCMRKLHIMGVVADVPACHARVRALLKDKFGVV